MGRAWAEGTLSAAPREDDAVSDARAWGLELDAESVAMINGEPLEVWAWHEEALTAFLAVQNQWRMAVGPAGSFPVGLDLQAAEAGFRLAGINMTPALWAEVQMIEAGAMSVMRKGMS